MLFQASTQSLTLINFGFADWIHKSDWHGSFEGDKYVGRVNFQV
jgi:hypothetical protein